MKASAFSYARATSIDNAIELLAAHGDGAKVLSGGQSLMPAMNLRLLAPQLIVDIGALAELRGITVAGGLMRVGALTRHCELLKSCAITLHAPLVAEAIAHVAHPRFATAERSAAVSRTPIRPLNCRLAWWR